MDLTPIRTKRLYEEIVEQIRQLISDGKLKPGDKLLAERELADRFQVSRASVREAIRTLEMLGVIDIRPGEGTFIRETEADDIIRPLDKPLQSEGGLAVVKGTLAPRLAGMLLLTASLSMLNAQPAEAKTNADEMHDAAARASIAVVPLTIPLLTGPATMSTVVIYADKAKTVLQLATLVGYGVVVALASLLCFSLAAPIARVLGKTGISVMTRLMGLILAALAVEVMSDGLTKLFPALHG